ncbi:MAG TPA: ferritin-like domain-containing protein [Polyangiaceae bacterium]|jgi:hypothetical protein
MPREIDWNALDASGLPAEKRAVVAATWKERARQEHLAVGAFALVAQELAREGCDPVVLALATKASWDEVRHTDVCRKMAAALGEKVPVAYRGLPKVPMHAGASDRLRVLLHVVEMCCFSETITGVYFNEMQRRATNPVARSVIASLLEDELDHGRLGWAYLATRRRDGTLDDLAPALPAILERTALRALAPRPGGDDDPAMEAFGFLGNTAARETVVRALDDVIVPGFATFDVQVERRW